MQSFFRKSRFSRRSVGFSKGAPGHPRDVGRLKGDHRIPNQNSLRAATRKFDPLNPEPVNTSPINFPHYLHSKKSRAAI